MSMRHCEMCGKESPTLYEACIDCVCTTSCCLNNPPPANPLFPLGRFQSALVKHALVPAEALNDPEWFDAGRTLAATREAYDELFNATGERTLPAGEKL